MDSNDSGRAGASPAAGPGDPTAAEPAREVLTERQAAQVLAAQRRARHARAPWTSMVLSLAVVLGILLGMALLVPRQNGISQPPVNVVLGARAAADRVDFTPSVPTGLREGWRASSVRTTRSTEGVLTWHVGYQTPGDQYAGVEQGQDAPAPWVQALTNRGRPNGTEQVSGEQWQRLAGGRGNQNSLVHTRGRVTTVVTGTATFVELAELAASLRPPG